MLISKVELQQPKSIDERVRDLEVRSEFSKRPHKISLDLLDGDTLGNKTDPRDCYITEVHSGQDILDRQAADIPIASFSASEVLVAKSGYADDMLPEPAVRYDYETYRNHTELYLDTMQDEEGVAHRTVKNKKNHAPIIYEDQPRSYCILNSTKGGCPHGKHCIISHLPDPLREYLETFHAKLCQVVPQQAIDDCRRECINVIATRLIPGRRYGYLIKTDLEDPESLAEKTSRPIPNVPNYSATHDDGTSKFAETRYHFPISHYNTSLPKGGILFIDVLREIDSDFCCPVAEQ